MRTGTSLTSLITALLAVATFAPPPAAARCTAAGLASPGGARVPIRGRCVSASPGSREAVAAPTVEGPVTGGSGAPTIQATSFDLADVGYRADEYFVSGVADAYVSVGALGSDGRWTVTPAERADYKTRVLVYRPIDAAAFNGNVVVEWLNVSAGLDAAPDWTMLHTELTREGYAWVGVSAQRVGIEGSPGGGPLPGVELHLKGADPERYGSLSHPGDDFSYDMYSQVAAAIRRPGGLDLLGGLRPDRVFAVGESQSAFRMMTYVNALAPRHGLFDGYLIHSRGSGGASLSDASEPVPSVLHVRTDLAVPVMMLQMETDLFTLGSLGSRQPDSRWFRLWEVAGTAHADTYTLMVGFTDRGDDPSVADVVITASPIPGIIDCESPINSGPQHFVGKATLAALERWARTGAAPRRASRLEVAGDPPAFVVDEYGNVRGGIRTSWVEAPVATLSGLGQSGGAFCGIFGTTTPFDTATLDELYPDHETYVRRVAGATNRAVLWGYLRRTDGDLIKAAAEASDVGR